MKKSDIKCRICKTKFIKNGFFDQKYFKKFNYGLNECAFINCPECGEVVPTISESVIKYDIREYATLVKMLNKNDRKAYKRRNKINKKLKLIDYNWE